MNFRKKPIVIEAVQWLGTFESYHNVCLFVGESLQNNHCGQDEPQELYIDTMEGKMVASKSDWIIKGIKGEFYPCKDEIFRETYEAVE